MLLFRSMLVLRLLIVLIRYDNQHARNAGGWERFTPGSPIVMGVAGCLTFFIILVARAAKSDTAPTPCWHELKNFCSAQVLRQL
jgi:hypothetical protein